METLIYQLVLAASYCIGWAKSPGCLSVTELTIVRTPPRLLVPWIVLGVAAVESL